MDKRFFLLIALLILIFSDLLKAQLIDYVWTKHVIEANDQYGSNTKESLDSNILLLQYDNNGSPALKKLDREGNLLWRHSDTSIKNSKYLEYTKDSKVVILNNNYSTDKINPSNCCISKYDDTMKLIWRKIYDNYFRDEGNKIKQTQDKGFLIVGTSGINDSNILYCWALKTDSSGAIEWQIRFGDSLPSLYKPFNMLYDMLELPNNNGYVCVGVHGSFYTSRGYFVHISDNGKLINKTTIDSSGQIYAIDKFTDTTFILGGTSKSGTDQGSYFYCSVDIQGKIMWRKMGSSFLHPNIYSLCKTNDNYALLGIDSDWGSPYILQINPKGDSIGSLKTNYYWDSKIQPFSKNEFISNGRIRSSNEDDIGLTKHKINYPPYFTYQQKIKFDTCTEDQPYLFQFTAQDSFPTDSIRYSISNGSISSMHINDSSGIFSWTPTSESDSGNHAITVVCYDRLNQIDSILFYLYARAMNDPPAIIDNIPKSFILDSLYSIPLGAIDEENDTINWVLSKSPPNMIIDSNKLFWNPTMVGQDTIILIASDGTSADTLTSIIKVIKLSVEAQYSSFKTMPSNLTLSSMSRIETTNILIGLPYGRNYATAKIYSISGRLIESHNISGYGWHQINIKKCPKGVLIARLSAGGKTIEKKIIIR